MEERDPDFVEKAVAIMARQLHPPTDGPTFGVDEQTGMGVREPAAPSQPPAPNRPARREHAYIRHGTADRLAAFCVNTGEVTGLVRLRHRAEEFIALLQHRTQQGPADQVIHLILDPVRMHDAAKVTAFLAERPGRFCCHWLPVHGSWRSCIEAWFAILSKKCLKRAEFPDFAVAAQWIAGFIATDNGHHAKPFTFKQGVKFYQRLNDKLAERHAPLPTDLLATAPDLAPAA